MSTDEVMPEVSTDGKFDGVQYFGVGPFYCSDRTDMAYLYDPNGEVPWEVNQSGSHTLSLSAAQAESLWLQLGTRLGK